MSGEGPMVFSATATRGRQALPPAGRTAALAPATEAFVQVEHLRKSYGPVVALDGLTLAIRRGEALGLLGPNGAGKTTLMHALAGVIVCDEGVVLIDGADPSRPRTRRTIGLAPQVVALYPQLTAEENLRFFGRIYGVGGGELEARVRWGLALSDLEARAHERVGHFSGGMQRRLNLACAVMHQPALLLLDEPTAGVDPQSRNRLFEEIETLKTGGLTVVCSTHLTEEAARSCDRVAIVDRGRVLAIGTTGELLERHASADLQTLLLSLTGKELRD